MSKNPIRWAEQAREFLNEVQIEFKKVTWPGQQDVVAGTVAVVVVGVVFVVVLGSIDWGLSRVVGALLR